MIRHAEMEIEYWTDRYQELGEEIAEDAMYKAIYTAAKLKQKFDNQVGLTESMSIAVESSSSAVQSGGR